MFNNQQSENPQKIKEGGRAGQTEAIHFVYYSISKKVKFTLEQAMNAHSGSTGIALLYP